MSFENRKDVLVFPNGIWELKFDEVDLVNGASSTSDALYVVAGTAATVASVAAKVGAPQVAAGAAVVGLVAFVAASVIS